MAFRDLKRLQLAIETYCQPGFEFPNSARESDRITAIALSDSTGWERLISGKEFDEAEMLRELVKEIGQRDPDVIEGHNLFRFDLEYIEARARKHKVELKFGRNGSRLSGHASRMQMAERTITYRKYEIFGRHVIDTWILAQHYDVATRALENVGLKEHRPPFRHRQRRSDHHSRGQGQLVFRPRPRHFVSLLPSMTCAKPAPIAELLSPSHFVQAQIFPYSYQNIPLRGNATKIDALFPARVSLPRLTRCPVPTKAATSSAAIRIWSIREWPGAFSTAT